MDSSWQRRALQEAFVLLEKGGNSRLAADLKRIGEISDLDDRTMFRNKCLHDLFETYEHTDGNHEISALLKEICQRLDLKNMSFFVIQEPRGKILGERVFTTCSDDWIKFYIQNRFWSVDPAIGNFFDSGEDFFWENIIKKDNFNNPMLKTFLIMSNKFDIGKRGFTLYTDCSCNGSYALTIFSDQSQEKFANTIEENYDDLQIAANQFADYLIDQDSDVDTLVRSLGEDEMIVMRLLTAGLEESIIKKYMGIGGELCSTIFSIKRKLGVQTVQQAVHRIASSNDFRSVPPLLHEIHCYRQNTDSVA